MRVSWKLTALIACCLSGCTEVFEAAPVATEQSAESQETSQTEARQAPPPQKPPTGPPPSAVAEGNQRVQAQAGVAAAGRSLDNETGVARVIVEPVRTLYAFKENAVFRFQIPQAMQLFKASEGQFPQSHEEFMAKIVRANKLRLPELPPGQRYVYDPQRGELMVERPVE